MANKKYSIGDMQKIATKRNGSCLSKKYISMKVKLKWKCKEGHIWKVAPNSIVYGDTWCPECRWDTVSQKNRKYSVKDLKEFAIKKGGKCLAKEYDTIFTPVKWKCKCGYSWKTAWHCVKNSGTWCPRCSKVKPWSLKKIKAVAKERGGECLSTKFKNTRCKLKWKCKEGHKWEASSGHILRSGAWCPECAGVKKDTIQNLKRLAASRGGKCLSENYKNGREKLTWQCSDGHVWKAPAQSIKSGRWCPNCSLLGERICRFFFENILNAKFPKRRPAWLKSEKGGQLELDGYCGKLRIAFEHQGVHRKSINYMIKTKKELKRRMYLDDLKKKLCKANNVILVEVPQVGVEIQACELKKFIIGEVRKNKIRVSRKVERKEIDYSEAFNTNRLRRLQEIAKRKGGKLITKAYLGVLAKHEWECQYGHRWEAVPAKIKGCKNEKPTWCPKCARRKKLSLEDLHELALLKNGKCLSKKYFNNHKKYLWQCEHGHIWRTTPAHIKGTPNQPGTWCPKCAKRKYLTIKDMEEIAFKRNGKCLSKRYKRLSERLMWKCEKGHTWKGTANGVKSGSWCPYCTWNKISIEQMKEIAIERGGLCLSKSVARGSDKLKWSCSRGHIWFAIANSVKQGRWCGKCVRKRKKENKTINDMNKLAQESNGECLSKRYLGGKNKLKWKCSKNHIWTATYQSARLVWCVKCRSEKHISDKLMKLSKDANFSMTAIGQEKQRIKWKCKKDHVWLATPGTFKFKNCPKCQLQKKCKELEIFVKKKGGRFISKNYANEDSCLSFFCKYGHRWETKVSHVKRGSWCPKCSGVLKKNIKDMKAIAKLKKGKCLSTKYENSHKHLSWECMRGHRWKAMPTNIQQGKWCPKCRGR